MQNATTQIWLDTRRALKDGTYPVKLRVTYSREQKNYSTGVHVTGEEYEKMQSARPGRELKELKLKLEAKERKAVEVIDRLPRFSFTAFERRLNSDAPDNEVFSAYDSVIARLRQEGREATAESYRNSRNSIWDFISGSPSTSRKGMKKKEIEAVMEEKRIASPLPFSHITPDFLHDYEKWMLRNGRSISTVGIYLRPLRTLFNSAISSREISPELYPFGVRSYQTPSGENIKKALTLAEIGKIARYSSANESEMRSRDMWLFSYLCGGINIKDMARLRYRQLDGSMINFVRAKTARSTRQRQRSIAIPMRPEALEIIQRWGNRPADSDNFVFPILSERLTPAAELVKVKQATKTINKYMERIGKAVGIKDKVTTYTARHSFATILMHSGEPTALISEALGHSSEKTTRSYLASFKDESKHAAFSRLTAFPEE
jgi:integrase/recombinase XerD